MKTKKRRLLSNMGSAENLRVSLQYHDPAKFKTKWQVMQEITHFRESILDEQNNQNRSTVIKLIERKIKQYKKRLEELS